MKRTLLLMLLVAAPSFAQTTTQFVCRDLKESGGFIYQGETVVGDRACRPATDTAVQQGVPAVAPTPTPATASSREARPAGVGVGNGFAGNERSVLHRVEVFAGYSYQRFDVPNTTHINMNGLALSGTVNIYKWFGAEGDFFGDYASNCGGATGLNCHDFTYGGGPRFTYRTKRTALFSHLLLGGNHSAVSFSGLSGTDNSLALLGGGGVDYQASSHFGIRLGQFDYLMTQHGNNAGVPRQNNLMYSAGAVFWF